MAKSKAEETLETKETVDNKEAEAYIKKLNDDLETQKKLAEEYCDGLKRNMAEFDNYKKRMSKEKETLYSSTLSSVISEMLPIIDNFEKAKDANEQKYGNKYNFYFDFMNKLKQQNEIVRKKQIALCYMLLRYDASLKTRGRAKRGDLAICISDLPAPSTECVFKNISHFEYTRIQTIISEFQTQYKQETDIIKQLKNMKSEIEEQWEKEKIKRKYQYAFKYNSTRALDANAIGFIKFNEKLEALKYDCASINDLKSLYEINNSLVHSIQELMKTDDRILVPYIIKKLNPIFTAIQDKIRNIELDLEKEKLKSEKEKGEEKNI